jgi:DNA repair ATPase RecN
LRIVRIKSIRTNSGFLEKCRVDFESRMTCIIGARGTCKSTLVESIRFVFDADTDLVAKLVGPEGMITKTLGAGSVTCLLEVMEDGQTSEYAIEREIGGVPRLARGGVRDTLAQDLLHEIEIYSQGALQQIASSDKPQLRLKLIDRPNRDNIRHLQKQIEVRVSELKDIGSNLRLIRGDIDKRRLEVRDLEPLRADLGRSVQTRPVLPPTLEEHHAKYIQRQRALDLLKDLQVLQQQVIKHLATTEPFQDKLQAAAEELRSLGIPDVGPAVALVEALTGEIRKVSELQKQAATVPIASELSKLTTDFERLNEDYYRQRQQQQEVTESLKREDQVRSRVASLEKIDRDLKEIEGKGKTFSERRKRVRAELAQLRDEIFEMRVGEANRINQEFGDVVLLTVRRAAHSKPYVDRLSELLAGSRVRTQGNIAEELAKSLPPSELLEVIETGDAQRLSNLLGRDLGQITRVITYLRDHPELYDLEGELFDDSLDITMFDAGQAKPVEDLSEGQRATALLPLILRASSCPLIIDQPEDDLDNSFIFQVLVKNAIRLKNERQLIFVTHNANIPVLGDAERIIVMHMENPNKAAAPRSGDLEERKEDILQLLEGGKEAFEHREQRYRSLLQ